MQSFQILVPASAAQSPQSSPSTTNGPNAPPFGNTVSFQNESAHYCGTSDSAQYPNCISSSTPDGINGEDYEFKAAYPAKGPTSLYFLHFPVCNCSISGNAKILTIEQYSDSGTIETLTVELASNLTVILQLTFNSNTGEQQVVLENLGAVKANQGAVIGFGYYGGVSNGQTITVTPYQDGVFGANKPGNHLTLSYEFSYTVYGSVEIVDANGTVFGNQLSGSALHQWGYFGNFQAEVNLEDQWDIIGAASGSTTPSFIINMGDNLDFWGVRIQTGGILWMNNDAQQPLGFSQGEPAYVTAPNTGSKSCSKFAFTIPTAEGTITGTLSVIAKLGGGCSFEEGTITGSLTLGSTTYAVSGIDFEFRCVSGNLTNCTNALIPTTTSVSCSPATVAVNQQTTCQATVVSSDPKIVPIDDVTFSAASGTFNPPTCVLSSGVCSVQFTPSLGSEGSLGVSASYVPDPSHLASSGSTQLSATTRSTSTVITCTPSTIPLESTSTCVASVQDTSSGNAVDPSGTVTFGISPSGDGNLNSTACTLSATGACAVTYTVTSAEGSVTITGAYSGDANHATSLGTFQMTVGVPDSTIQTTLSPGITVVEGAAVSDTATLSQVTNNAGGTITFYFSTSNVCPSGNAQQVGNPVQVSGAGLYSSSSATFETIGTYYWYAMYSGDSNNPPVTSPCEPLTVTLSAPTLSISLSSSTIFVGNSVTISAQLSGETGNAGGTVSYGYYIGLACSGTIISLGTVQVTDGSVPSSGPQVFSSSASYSIVASYSGDSDNSPTTSTCQTLTVSPLSPSISAALSSSTISAGQSVYGSATLSGETDNAGGTVTYYLYSNGGCTGTGSTIGTPVPVVNGLVPDSTLQIVNIAGTSGMQAVYNGDTNNLPATSACQVLTVNIASPTLSITLSATSIMTGQSVYAASALSGETSNAVGAVVYGVYSGSSCSGTASWQSFQSVVDGVVPNSTPDTFDSPGTFSWQASYGGDANNAPATSSCETLTATGNQLDPTKTVVTASSTNPVIGTTDTLTATVNDTSSTPTAPTGTVTWTDNGAGGKFSKNSCTLTGSSNPTTCKVTYSPPASQPSSGTVTITATYSGDSFHLANSRVLSLTIVKRTTSTSVTVTPSQIASSGSVTVSATVTDTNAGTATSPTGTLTLSANVQGGSFSSATCTLSATGSAASSCSVSYSAPATIGTAAITASYSGDSAHKTSSGSSSLTVTQAVTSLATTLSAGSIQVGGFASDEAILSGAAPTAGGTISFYYSSIEACPTGGASPAGEAVTVSGPGTYSASSVVTFPSAGTFYWYAIYSGDANNAGSTSPCEPLIVTLATASLSTQLSSSSILAGTSVFDSATLTGSYNAGGTVTYEYFSTGTCSGTATIVGSPVQVLNGLVPNSASETFSYTGSYSWNAVYSGDANNNPATSACEPLTVNPLSPTISASLSTTSINVGGSVYDSAILSGASTNAGGTVTYEYYADSTCIGTQVVVGSPLTVVNGVAPNSIQQAFEVGGMYSWNAVYSGDANNNPATSACEPLTVIDTPTISVSLSSYSITSDGSITASAILSGEYSNAGGTATYYLYASGTCSGIPSTIGSPVTVSNGIIPNSAQQTIQNAGSYGIIAVYNGDSNDAGATSNCVGLVVISSMSSIVATLSSKSIDLGGSAYDTAALSGVTSGAGGTVTYDAFHGGTCSGTATQAGNPVIVVNGIVPNSPSGTFSTAGTYSWDAIYSGDPFNAKAISNCEPMTVASTAAHSTSATLSGASSATIGTSITITVSIKDKSSTGATPPGGTVLWSDGGAGGIFAPSTAQCVLSGGTNPATCTIGYTPPTTEPASGSITVTALYSGDATHAHSSGTLKISINLRTTSTTVTFTPSTTSAGGTVSVTATIVDTNAGSPSSPSGTVAWSASASGGTFSTASCPLSSTGGATSACSVSYTAASTAGGVTITATYSGDGSHSGSSGNSLLSVSQAITTLTTSLSSGTIVVGGSDSDLATLAGATPDAGGSITFFDSTTSFCSSATSTQVGSAIQVSGPGTYSSATLSFSSSGNYYWYAVYSGDSNNQPATSPCETLLVMSAPTISLSLNPSSTTVGGSVYGSAQLSEETSNAGGTVVYEYYVGGVCGGSPNQIGSPVAVTNTLVPVSTGELFTSSGLYSWEALYSGDTNNNPATSQCMSLSVSPDSPSISGPLSSSSIVVGNSVIDEAGLTGASTNAGGTVTYEYFSTGTCSGTATVAGSPVTVVNGVVPSSPQQIFSSAGTYGWVAVYSGDANNNGATSSCSSLAVTQATPVISTALSATSIEAGASVTDSATLTGSYNAGGTVTYEYFSTGTCSGTATVAGSPVTVVNGVVPSSPQQIFSTAGSYSWSALYTGDANNMGAISACESLTVTPAIVDPTVTSISGPTTSSVTIGSSASLKVNVKDMAEGPTSPTGTVTWSDGGAGGTFTPSASCSLSGTGNPTTCNVTYSPPSTEPASTSVAITATYTGDSGHFGSAGTIKLVVVNTVTTVLVSPSTEIAGDIVPITVTATVNDTTSSPVSPAGTITWSATSGDGTFSSSTCTLSTVSSSASSCQAIFTPTSSLEAANSPITITASYGQNAGHLASSGTAKVTIKSRSTTTTVKANPSGPTPGASTTLTVIVTDTSPGTSSNPTGTVTFTASATGGAFSGGGACTLTPVTGSSTQATCSITYTMPTGTSSVTITAKYNGDTLHTTSSATAKLT